MEHELRCNNLSCRALLSSTGQTDSNAIVTTCSHIFCVTCAQSIFTAARLCQACESSLPDDDDIVYTSLNPSQTFRTTILAGMNPMIVQDICARALGFWTYQVSQEIRLQEAVLKDAKERSTQVERQMANIVREANSEVALLGDKIKDLQDELDQSMRKNRELAEANRMNMNEYTKLKMQYEKVMSKSTMATAYGKASVAVPVGGGEHGDGQRGNPSRLGTTTSALGHGRIGATPSRAFQPAPIPGSVRRANPQPLQTTVQPVNYHDPPPYAPMGGVPSKHVIVPSGVSRASTGSGRGGGEGAGFAQAGRSGNDQVNTYGAQGQSYGQQRSGLQMHGQGAQQQYGQSKRSAVQQLAGSTKIRVSMPPVPDGYRGAAR